MGTTEDDDGSVEIRELGGTAWINWSRSKRRHLFGLELARWPVAMCGTIVREQRGMFDPAADDACPECAAVARAGLTFAEYREKRVRLKPGPGDFVCGR
ncbi:MAG: hypothetical protein ACRDXE_08195 [Acidimicrobiales bacterium]